MKTNGLSAFLPVQIEDITDRVACFQNMYKDLLSAHVCAPIFEGQLDVVGKALADLAEQTHLASLYCQATPTGREEIMSMANRVASKSRS